MYDELINKLYHCANEVFCNKCSYSPDCAGEKTIIREAADAIEELQGKTKVLEKLADHWCNKVPKWIPVTERLPRKDDDVLLWSEWIGVSGTIYKDISLSSFSEITNMGYKVTHWMPLPEPPESEGE